jgi:hypothetical protein
MSGLAFVQIQKLCEEFVEFLDQKSCLVSDAFQGQTAHCHVLVQFEFRGWPVVKFKEYGFVGYSALGKAQVCDGIRIMVSSFD